MNPDCFTWIVLEHTVLVLHDDETIWDGAGGGERLPHAVGGPGELAQLGGDGARLGVAGPAPRPRPAPPRLALAPELPCTPGDRTKP